MFPHRLNRRDAYLGTPGTPDTRTNVESTSSKVQPQPVDSPIQTDITQRKQYPDLPLGKQGNGRP